MVRCIALVFALFLLTGLHAACAQGERGPVGLSVSGTGEIKTAPDIARISLGVLTQAKEAAAAAQENAARVTAIMGALKKAGIAEKDIETAMYNVNPMYDYKEGTQILTGYQVSNIVRVSTKKLDMVGRLIDAGLSAGANNVQGVTFDIENEEPLKQQALAKAIEAAQAKARVMAAALKIELGRVLSVTESEQPVYVPQPMGVMYAEARTTVPTPISPQQLTVRASVQVTYAILGG